MTKILDSNDIIEMFSHSSDVGQNSIGVYVVPGGGGRNARYPPAWFFVSETGIEPIKTTICDALKIRQGSMATDPVPHWLDLSKLIPARYSVNYFDVTDEAGSLGFAILLPNGYEIDIPRREMMSVLSRIFQALTYPTGGRC
jgi:hypothetical protein